MSEERALTTYQSPHLMPAMSISDAAERFLALQRFTKTIMREGTDYGTVPGTDKPTLFKPGAEKLTTFFGLSVRQIIIEKVEDWTGANHGGEPFFYYWSRCQLHRGDMLIAEADGSCNSWETKYRYRWADRVCPECGKTTIIKGKSEYGGGWLCWTKRGGCGKKWPSGAPEIEGQQLGRVPNPDPAEIVNTVLKMSQKRALVAATLLAVNASEYFTQDLEDLDLGTINGEYSVGPTSSQGKPRQNPPPPTNGKCPICHATGNGHAPWCQEVDGKRVDTREDEPPPEWDAATVAAGEDEAESETEAEPSADDKRPLAAVDIRATIRQKAGWQDGARLDGEPITEKQKPTLVGLLAQAVKKKGMTGPEMDKARYDVMGYLLGVHSTVELTKREASAMISWLCLPDDVSAINAYARTEAAAILTALAVEQGQGQLL